MISLQLEFRLDHSARGFDATYVKETTAACHQTVIWSIFQLFSKMRMFRSLFFVPMVMREWTILKRKRCCLQIWSVFT